MNYTRELSPSEIKKPPMGYQIVAVEGDTFTEAVLALEDEVHAMIADGWEPLGGLHNSMGEMCEVLIFQPMVKQ